MITLGPDSGRRWQGRKDAAQRLQRYGVNRAQARAFAWHPKSPAGRAAVDLAVKLQQGAVKDALETATK